MAWLRRSHLQGFCTWKALVTTGFQEEPCQSLQSVSLLKNAMKVYLRPYNGATLLEQLLNPVVKHHRKECCSLEGLNINKVIPKEFATVAGSKATKGESSTARSCLVEIDSNARIEVEEFVDNRRMLDTYQGPAILESGSVALSEDGRSVRGSTQVENNIQKGPQENRDNVHEELPIQCLEENSVETSPYENMFLRRRVGKIAGEIEGHNRILEKIRSLGACNTLPQKQEKKISQPETLSFEQHCKIVSKEEPVGLEDLESSEVSHSKTNETEQTKRPPVLGEVQPPRLRLLVKFLNSTATSDDLLQAFADCGEIVRAQAVKPTKQNLKFTYGFVDFKTAEGLSKALQKNVKIKGFKVELEPSTLHSSDGASIPNLDFSILKKLAPIGTSSNPSASILSTLKSSCTEKVNDSANNFDISKVISLIRAKRATNPEDLKMSVESEQTALKSEVYMVGIRDVPAAMELHRVQEALSIFGETVCSYVRKEECGGSCVCIEFVSEEAKESALALHWIYINGLQLRISRIDSPKTTVIRISNIHRDTAKSEIFSTCIACGQVTRIESRIHGVVDVYFEKHELKNINRILDRLNETVLHHKRWMANPAPRIENIAVRDDEFVRLQKDKLFQDIQRSLQHITMYFEDLSRLDRL